MTPRPSPWRALAYALAFASALSWGLRAAFTYVTR